jgi:type I restriction enzyme S subunit
LDMASEWVTSSVGEVSHVVTKGTTPTTLGFQFQNDGIRFVKVETLSSDGAFFPDKFAYICEEAHNALARSQLQEDDILFSIAGTIGRTALVTSDWLPANTNQAIAIVRPNTRIVTPKFLRYVLANPSFTQTANTKTVQSVQANFSLGELKLSKFDLPPISVQQEIVGLLGSLDDRIALLRETNKTLEAIAQAIFKSWFIDFDPVRAKMEGRAPAGLDEEAAALFPDELVDSELGLVPKGWGVEGLDQVANYLNGLALQKFPPTGHDDLPVIKIAQLRKGDTIGADKASRALKPEYIVKDGDVLFSWSGSLEVEIWCGGEGALNQHLFKVTSEKFEKWFYFLWTRKHLEHFRQIAASKATTMGHIQRSHLSDAKVIVPDEKVLAVANDLFSPIVDRITSNALQAKTLAEIRDGLLPRLISGKLRLSGSLENVA